MPKKEIGLGIVNNSPNEKYTAEDIREWFYNGTRKAKEMKIKDEVVDLINETLADPEFDGYKLKETMIEYQDILLDKSQVNLEHYVNAIKFCGFLETCGGNATQAYIKTFRHRDFVKKALKAIEDDPEKGYESQDYMNIYAAACRYRKSPMVKEILIQSAIPLSYMFQGYSYKLADKLYEEAMTAKASRDRIQAMNVFFTHFKLPEAQQIDLNIKNSKGNDFVTQMEEMMKNMSLAQQKLIDSGEKAEVVANIKDSYIDAEVVENDDA